MNLAHTEKTEQVSFPVKADTLAEELMVLKIYQDPSLAKVLKEAFNGEIAFFNAVAPKMGFVFSAKKSKAWPTPEKYEMRLKAVFSVLVEKDKEKRGGTTAQIAEHLCYASKYIFSGNTDKLTPDQTQEAANKTLRRINSF